MPEGSVKAVKKDYSYTQNRELSWLRFNRRVLEEAADNTVPLLEHLKFISIFTSNLDEFFMIRVGSLFDLAAISGNKERDNKSGMSPLEQLRSVYDTIPPLIDLKNRLYDTLCTQLDAEGITDVSMEQLTEVEAQYVSRYYAANVLPTLSPQIVDSHHPFPHLETKRLYISLLLREKKDRLSLGFVPLPASVPSFLMLPNSSGRYLRMEQMLLHRAPSLFERYKVVDSCVICVTRNADISFDVDKFEDTTEEDFRNHVSKLLHLRGKQSAVRLELSRPVSQSFLDILRKRLDLEPYQVYVDRSPLNMSYVFALIDQLPSDVSKKLLFPPYQPRQPEDLKPKVSMIQQIQQRDRLLFYPFDSVNPFLQLLQEAAERKDVIAIKITIYRLASSSKIARILCRAAENGKEVTVLMELRARFDEANNIAWSKVLEEAGCRVIYGVEDYKCHSKICQITLRRGDSLNYITQIGTGNYNEKTCAMYTDLCLMTANKQIGLDGAAFFRNMLVSNLNGSYQRLLVSPNGIQQALLDHMDEQIILGQRGYICIKANSLTERTIIDKLQQASQAGVEVQLILRGICCIRPGIPGKTESLHVTSIVGRYLEHARIYCFGRGDQAKYFISSADLMTRNLLRRVEIACPIDDPQVKSQLEWILHTQLLDNVKASSMLSDGSYLRKTSTASPLNSQEEFMRTSSHTALAAAEPRTSKPRVSLLQRLKDRIPWTITRKY